MRLLTWRFLGCPLLVCPLLVAVAACTGGAEQPAPTDEALRAGFNETFTQFYETYARADIGFVDYYTDDVITIDDAGEVTMGSAMYREAWTENFQQYTIDLLEYTKPQIVFSRDQIVSYNDYDELFISNETGDTTRVRGTWIGVWERTGDVWRVRLNTFHIKSQADGAGTP